MQIRTPIMVLTVALSSAFGLAGQDTTASAVNAEIVMATGVIDREPVGGATAFPSDVGQVTAWTRITGAENTTVEHVWRHEDLEFVVSLNIGGSPWRTWSTKTIPPEWAGEWTLEVRTAAGETLGTATFTVGG